MYTMAKPHLYGPQRVSRVLQKAFRRPGLWWSDARPVQWLFNRDINGYPKL